MSRPIRRIAFVLALMLIALLVNVTVIQVVLAGDYRDRPGNQRVLLEEYDRERGPILVGPNAVARSKETGDTLRYLRVYSDGPLYAPVTGFYSLVYGATGLERTENRILTGRSSLFVVDRAEQLFAGREPAGGAVSTTIDARAQRAAFNGLRGKKGAVVAIEPATGRILASVQFPSFDPNILSSHDPAAIREYYATLEADPAKPLLNRPIVSLNPPGSTFKLVTAAAALASGRFTPDSVIPGPAHLRPAGLDQADPQLERAVVRTRRRRHAAAGTRDLVQHRVRLARQPARRRRAPDPGAADGVRRVLRDPPARGHVAVPRGSGRAADRHVGHRAVRRPGHGPADGHGHRGDRQQRQDDVPLPRAGGPRPRPRHPPDDRAEAVRPGDDAAATRRS